MRTDTQLQQAVLDALSTNQSIDTTCVGVGVWNGIVTLVGHVSTLAEKLEVEHIAQQVSGEMALDVEIDVTPGRTPVCRDS